MQEAGGAEGQGGWADAGCWAGSGAGDVVRVGGGGAAAGEDLPEGDGADAGGGAGAGAGAVEGSCFIWAESEDFGLEGSGAADWLFGVAVIGYLEAICCFPFFLC